MTQSIQNFWRSSWSVWTMLPGCWQLKNKNNSSSTINNHRLFDVQTKYNSTREWERECVRVIWTNTKRHAPTTARENSLNENFRQLTDWQTDYFFKIFKLLYNQIKDIGGGIYCNILTFDAAVNQETGASGRRYQGITLTMDGLNWVQIRRSQRADGCQATI